MLKNYKREENEFWDFKNESMKQGKHQIHPYPAMLMPSICRELIKIYKNNKKVFLDPFMGSGTSLLEAQRYNFEKIYGIDINPQAVLISKTKTKNFNLDKIKKGIEKIYGIDINPQAVLISKTKTKNFNLDKIKKGIETIFQKDKVVLEDYEKNLMIENWFKKEVIKELLMIKNKIKLIDDEQQDFFWCSFSELVRKVSLTRNSEFKLYKMEKNKIENFNPNVYEEFKKILLKNFEVIKNDKIVFNGELEIFLDNILETKKLEKIKNKVDLIITSPPYGDSGTTVAYGQFSRLSNEWLDFEDCKNVDKKILGGGKTKKDFFEIEEINKIILKIKEKEEDKKNKRYKDVIVFLEDYWNSIKIINEFVKKEGIVIFIVGNRRVRDVEIELDKITYLMFKKLNYKHEKTIVRNILNKRLPSKVSISGTKEKTEKTNSMKKEYIVIMKKQ